LDVVFAVLVCKPDDFVLVDNGLVLICVPTHHHVRLRHSSASHDDVMVAFFDDGYSATVVSDVADLLAIVGPVVLLAGDHGASKNLGVLDLDLRVVENVIVIVDVFDYFYWLLVRLLFRLR
jgi:hypothetical protein